MPDFLAKLLNISEAVSAHWLIGELLQRSPEWLGPGIGAITVILIVVWRTRQPLRELDTQSQSFVPSGKIVVMREPNGDLAIKSEHLSFVAKASDTRLKRKPAPAKSKKRPQRQKGSKS